MLFIKYSLFYVFILLNKDVNKIEFVLPGQKELIILFKTQRVEKFNPQISTNFRLETKLMNGKLNSENLYSNYYFDENLLIDVNKLERNNFFEEDKNEINIDEIGRKTLEIEWRSKKVEPESEIEGFDQNEIIMKLISEDKEGVFKCEVAAIKNFDNCIGKHSTSINFFILYY